MNEPVILATYTLLVFGPEGWIGYPVGLLGTCLSEAEENISDLLPEGYYIKISEDEEDA